MLSLRLGVFRAVGSSAFRTLVLATVGLLLFSTGSNAQGGEGFVDFQFSFSNPGARSLGFGGAFVALADDATAAYANPAGLVQLIQPEVSVEGRFWSYSTAYTLGGRIDGEPTGIGIDSAVGLRTARSSDDIADLSFVSFVYDRFRDRRLGYLRGLPGERRSEPRPGRDLPRRGRFVHCGGATEALRGFDCRLLPGADRGVHGEPGTPTGPKGKCTRYHQ
jgi:hypothetical protein